MPGLVGSSIGAGQRAARRDKLKKEKNRNASTEVDEYGNDLKKKHNDGKHVD